MSAIPENLHGRQWKEWLVFFPQMAAIAEGKPILWNNTHGIPASNALTGSGFTVQDVEDASLRLQRFTSFLNKAFPETAAQHQGAVVSPLRYAPAVLEAVSALYKLPSCSRMLFKLDNQLPFSGTIKDRGGVYEVLKLAENLAMYAKMLKWSDDYARLMDPEFRKLFGGFNLSVIAGGNLALAAGRMGKTLGFKVRAHFSAGSETWKKDILRAWGIEYTEHETEYEEILKKQTQEAQSDKNCFIIHEESSRSLLLGYAVSGMELKAQLASMGVVVDAGRPLYVYLSCGSGMEAAGVCLGLKLAFQDNVRCFLAEPAQAPVITLGLGTGLYGQISVKEVGLSGRTFTDTSCRPSGLVCQVLCRLLDGCVTVDDKVLLRLLTMMHKRDPMKLEPPAIAGLAAFIVVAYSGLGSKFGQGTHVMWCNGGGLMPDAALEG